ncbi:MAG: hypothetical protein JSW58_04180 [Candidatus Latescibacterota bacterium]|nr:MAG: hypothetical protein JSW58_04180 [Candidatus Latescibacterota bacterium]
MFLFGDILRPELVAISIPIISIIGGCAIAIVAIIMASRKKELEHKERLSAMEKGIDIPQAPREEVRPPYLSNRTGGLVMTFIGIALTIGLWVSGGAIAGVWGLIPLAIGIGLLISSILEKREVDQKGFGDRGGQP